MSLTAETASNIATLAAQGLIVRLMPDGSIEARAPEDTRSPGARRTAAYRARRASQSVTEHHNSSQGVTCNATPAPSSSPSLPPSSPSPVPPTSPPTHTPPPAPPPSREGLFADGEVSGDKPKTKESSTLPTTLTAQRIAKMFHRKLTTPWSKKEIKAFKALGHIAEEDLAAVEAHYAEQWPPRTGVNCLRHDLGTFLNNFRGEVDRARSAQQKQQPAPVGQGGGFLAGTGFEQR